MEECSIALGGLVLGYRRRWKYYMLKLFRLHDSPKAVAGGLAWGTFVHFFPTCGFGALMAVGLARLGRANMVAATLGWAVTAPLFPLFFYLNFSLGFHLLGGKGELGLTLASMYDLHLNDLLLLGKVFFLGAIINGVLCVLLIGWVGKFFLQRYQKETLAWLRKNL